MGSRTSMVSRKNAMVINFAQSHTKLSFNWFFHTPSQKFEILAIPNVLVHRKSYEHGFVKKCNGH
ncbi:hypothetical protein BHE74_00057242 [Ensete ventricosum]|nr:hypothetical protein BHE74_00057242 [Ensete ventricosum]